MREKPIPVEALHYLGMSLTYLPKELRLEVEAYLDRVRPKAFWEELKKEPYGVVTTGQDD